MRELDDLVERVVDQTRRRVFDGDTVPATGKVASLFEPHTDIIREGGRRTHYGHKLNLTTGRSGLVLDAVVDDGNPADSERCLPMLDTYQHKRLTFVALLGEHLRRRCFAPSLGQSSPAGLVCGVKGDRFLGAWSKVNYFGW